MVIIEFAPHGDLLSFLRERRDVYEPNWVKKKNNPDQEFTLVDLAMAAYQICRGMEFLASRKVCKHSKLSVETRGGRTPPHPLPLHTKNIGAVPKIYNVYI